LANNNVTGTGPELDAKKVVKKQVDKHYNDPSYFNTVDERPHGGDTIPNVDLPQYPFTDASKQKNRPKKAPNKTLPWE